MRAGAHLGLGKVLQTFLDADGRITAFPKQEKKFLVILRHVLEAFEPGLRYPEKQVNEMLSRFNEDTATLRRCLVDYHLMAREGGGGAYWRLEAQALGVALRGAARHSGRHGQEVFNPFEVVFAERAMQP